MSDGVGARKSERECGIERNEVTEPFVIDKQREKRRKKTNKKMP